MKKLIEGFKNINKLDRIILIMIIIIFILLCTSMGISIAHIRDYSHNRDSGNERWKQVEQIIIDYKNKVDELEHMIQQDKLNEIN